MTALEHINDLADALDRRQRFARALDEAAKTLYVGRHCGPYDDQARMWDKLGQHSPEQFPAPRHAAEAPA